MIQKQNDYAGVYINVRVRRTNDVRWHVYTSVGTLVPKRGKEEMRKNEIEIGSYYVARVSGRLTIVRIDRESPYGGWDATNIKTKREIHLRSAARLRHVVVPR